MHQLILATFLVLHLTTVCRCQRYAERNPLPVQTIPSDTSYYDEDYDYTGGYDFKENKNIYRWNVEEFPHPLENFRFCNRMKSSYVCDPDQVLSTEEAEKLEKSIRELYQETPCICEQCSEEKGGIIVGIALMKNIFQPYNQHPSKTIRAFAEALRKNWKLGKCDNDILIVVATDDRMGCTEVGSSTSTYLSAEEAHRIYLENKAHFSDGHFYEGLQAMLSDYRGQTKDMSPARKQDGGLNLGLITGSIVGAILLLGVILFVAFVIYRRTRMRRNKEKVPDEPDDSKPDGVSTTWTKDIKVMFNSMKSGDNRTPPPPSSTTKYQPCDTEDKTDSPSNENEFKIDEEEVIDTTLAVPESHNATRLTLGDTSTTELLDKELTKAVEGLTTTFQPPKRQFNRHETDL